MRNKNLTIKKLIINGIVLLTILTGGCFIQNACIASDSPLDSLEQANVNESEMEQYLRLTRRRIKNNWYPPTTSFENSAILGITLDRSGKLIKCSIIQPSSSEEFDNSLIEAAKKTTYMPIPKDFIEDVVDLSFEFGMLRRKVEKN